MSAKVDKIIFERLPDGKLSGHPTYLLTGGGIKRATKIGSEIHYMTEFETTYHNEQAVKLKELLLNSKVKPILSKIIWSNLKNLLIFVKIIKTKN